MKFSCEKALLQAAISTTSRAVSPKSSIPALEGILLEADEELRLTGYNLETGIRTTVPAEIRTKGTLVLGARLFGEIIRKLPDDIVEFTAEHYMVNIKCGMSEFNILGTDPEEFPELPTVEYQNSLEIGQNKLKSMISQTLFAVSDNESRPIHTGSLFEVDQKGLTIVSVDGYRLALRHETIERKEGAEEFSFVVPAPPSPRWKKSVPMWKKLPPLPRAPAISCSKWGRPCWSPAGWRVNSSPTVRPSPATIPSGSRGKPAPSSPPSTASPSSSATN